MRRFKTGCLVVVALVCCLSRAGRADDFKLEAAKYRAVEDVVYGHKDGLAQTFDVLIPETGAKRIGVLLLVSGSWKSKKSNNAAEEDGLRRQHWAQGLLNGGYTLFLVRHGSAPRYFVPEMIQDVRRAVRVVRMRAKEYGVDPDRLGLVGGSSGGHLALMASFTGDDVKPDAKDPVERISSRVQAVMAWFPPTDMVNWGAENGYKMLEKARPSLFTDMFGKVTDLESQLRAISPIYHATADAPPVFLVHGDADKTVPLQQSQALKAKFEELKRPVRLIVQPGGPHTYWPGIEKNYPAIWEWFDRYLAGTLISK
ncbi:MAG: alpha/beta hydrolase fold domain-containing protein [Blastocatellia bacterium]|nr:alpha/beta hydrolase fold domain-containing protein [Blastocatellia bacterium]